MTENTYKLSNNLNFIVVKFGKAIFRGENIDKFQYAVVKAQIKSFLSGNQNETTVYKYKIWSYNKTVWTLQYNAAKIQFCDIV